MFTIRLKNLIFTAFHGIYEEERLLGNQYRVDCSVTLEDSGKEGIQLEDTVNYEVLYRIVKNRMEIPSPLLEAVSMEIGQLILKEFSKLKAVSITISKIHPMIEGFVGESEVTWSKEF